MNNDTQEQTAEKQEKKPRIPKKVRLFTIIILVIVAAVAIGGYFLLANRQGTEQNMPDNSRFTQMNGQSYVTATGTTAVGVEAEEFEIDFLEDTDLYVEEIYLDTGDEVEAGTQYLKFTDDSIKDARKELEDTALDASIEYRNSVISTQESKIKAQYDYQTTILTGQQAQAVYDDKIAELEQAQTEAEEAYQDAQDALTELQDNLTTGFAEEYEIDAKKKTYEEMKQLYEDILEKWDMSESDATSTSTSSDSSSAEGGAGGMMVSQDTVWRKKAVALLKDEVDESKEEYEKAMSNYDDAMENYEYQLKEAQNTLESAQEAYEEAQLNYQKESLSAKTTLETALAQAKTAQADYDTQITSLDEALSKLQDAEEDASDNLALFENTIGDGYLYTAGAGTILKVMAEEDSILTGGNVVIAYKDSSQMTVSVSVSQEYISQLTVGESAYVSIDEYGDFDGTITEINPVSSSSSRTSVTYSVEVTLDGDVSALSENLTANVVFGTTMEDMNTNMQQPGGNAPEGNAPGGNASEGNASEGNAPQENATEATGGAANE